MPNGRYSRRRGYRGEILLRDDLRAAGFVADRVPLSGASAYAKGDVRASKGGNTYVFEIKNITGVFQTVYRLFAQESTAGLLCVALGTEAEPVLLRISDTPDAAIAAEGHYAAGVVGKQLTGKLLNMRKLLKGADVLVIKDNQCPLLYMRFL